MDINATYFRTGDVLHALARPCQEEHPLAHLMANWDEEEAPDVLEVEIAPEYPGDQAAGPQDGVTET